MMYFVKCDRTLRLLVYVYVRQRASSMSFINVINTFFCKWILHFRIMDFFFYMRYYHSSRTTWTNFPLLFLAKNGNIPEYTECLRNRCLNFAVSYSILLFHSTVYLKSFYEQISYVELQQVIRHFLMLACMAQGSYFQQFLWTSCKSSKYSLANKKCLYLKKKEFPNLCLCDFHH